MAPDQEKAFSLIELLVTLALVATFAGIALPAYAAWVERNRHEALRHELLASLQAARALSIEHGRIVELCGARQSDACDETWQHGWRMHHPDRETLRFTAVDNLPGQLRWSGSLTKGIRFQPDGTTITSNGTFTLCRADGKPAWQLVLNRQGRVRSVTANSLPASCR